MCCQLSEVGHLGYLFMAQAFDQNLEVAGRGRGIKVSTRTIDTITYGSVDLDLSGVEQLAEKSQTRAIAFALQTISKQLSPHNSQSVSDIVYALDANIDKQVRSHNTVWAIETCQCPTPAQTMHLQGLDAVAPWLRCCDLARPRRFEVAAALNRLRTVRFKQ